MKNVMPLTTLSYSKKDLLETRELEELVAFVSNMIHPCIHIFYYENTGKTVLIIMVILNKVLTN